MARPPNADAGATRARVLGSALALFSRSGVERISIRDIAKHAGVTLATVHHYFGTKEQLYAACVEAMYAELEAFRLDVEPTLTSARSAAELVDRAVRRSFRFACAHRGALRLLMRTIVDTGELEPERRAEVHLPFLARGGQTLAALFGGSAGEMTLVVQSVMHLIVRYALTAPRELAHLAGVEGEDEAVDRIEDHVTRVAMTLVGAGEMKRRMS